MSANANATAKAWLEIDRIGPRTETTLTAWSRVPLDEPMTLIATPMQPPHQTYDDPTHRVVIARTREGPHAYAVVDVTRAGDRWVLRPHLRDAYRNGVVLQQGERYPLENGDRIEARPGTWLRFLDDTVPLPLPRLRQVGRAFLFSPSPPDGADQWHALLRGRDELFTAELAVASADEDAVLEAFPFVRDVVHTPRGLYALTSMAGVRLTTLLDRTREQQATIDDIVSDHIRSACTRAFEEARVAGWQQASVYGEQVLVTWEGEVTWLGFADTHGQMSPVQLRSRDPFAPHEGDSENDAAAPPEEIARTIAGMLAALFPEERASEMALREEVALWTRDGLAELERATRGRPSP